MEDGQAVRGIVSSGCCRRDGCGDRVELQGEALDLPACRCSDPQLCSRALVSDKENEVIDADGHRHLIRMLPLRGVLGMSIWPKSPGWAQD